MWKESSEISVIFPISTQEEPYPLFILLTRMVHLLPQMNLHWLIPPNHLESLSHFKAQLSVVYSVSLGKCIVLYSHYYTEYHTSLKILCALPIYLHSSGNHWSLYGLHSFVTMYSWNATLWSLFRLSSFL